MNRILKAFGLIALITFFASCKKDDDSFVPPRDFTVQYAAEKDSIEKYLKSHYIVNVDAEYNITFAKITSSSSQVSIWDQTQYPLQQKKVKSLNTNNTPEYTIYYLMLNQGVGESPTRADNVKVSYRGITLDGDQFDYMPFPEMPLLLSNTVEGWQEILPLFRPGNYVDVPGSPDPARYENYGAGAMWVPSGLGYYNTGSGSVGAYESMAFSFKLYAVDFLDTDGDGIQNRYERPNQTDDIYYVDTDGDGIPDYLDTDDDGDGFPTLIEIRKPNTSPAQYYSFDEIPTCPGGTLKKHLDPNCG